MTASLEVPNELIARARRAGVNCSAIARNAIEDAVQRLEQKEPRAQSPNQTRDITPSKVDV